MTYALGQTVVARIQFMPIAAGAAAMVASGGVIAIFFGDVGAALAIWNNSAAYGHCYLILPISLYFIYSRRFELSGVSPKLSAWGAGLFVGCLGIWWLGLAASTDELRQLALVGMLQGIVLGLLGWAVYRSILFPMLYLFLMVPTGTFLLGPLQTITTILSSNLLRLAGLPVFGENHLIEVAHGIYEVAPGCAGLNFLLTSLALSLIYAFLFFRGSLKRIAVVVIALLLSILVNAVRVFGIIWLAEATDRRIDIVDDHLLYGWGVFMIAALLAMYVGSRFRDLPSDIEAPQVKGGAFVKQKPGIWLAALAMMVLALGVRASAAAIDPMTMSNPRIQIDLPVSVGDWRKSETGASFVLVPSSPADALVQRAYVKASDRVDVSAVYYWRQRPGHKLGDLAINIAANQKWAVESQSPEVVSLKDIPTKVEAIRLTLGNRRILVWSYYWVGGSRTANTVAARLLGMASSFGADGRSAMILLSAPDDDGRGKTILTDFFHGVEMLERALADAALRAN